MKRHIDLEAAAQAEAFGVLAVSRSPKHRGTQSAGKRFTPAQKRALSDFARSLVKVAKEAGAANECITVGGVSFELHESAKEDILSIRTSNGS